MAHDNVDEVLAESTLTRRTLLTRSAQGAAAISLGGLLTAGPAFGRGGAQVVTIRWISPRGTLEVMDDYNLWVPIKMGYFKELGINVKLIGGPLGDALASAKFVGQNQADVGYPSPGVLTAAIDAGVEVKSAWDMISGQVFDFALPLNSPLKNAKELKGKRIALGSAGWSAIVDPMLVELGDQPEDGQVRDRGHPVGAGRRAGTGRRGPVLARPQRAVERSGAEAQVPDRDDLLEAALERVLRPKRRSRRSGEEGPVHALLPRRGHGSRVRPGQPESGRADHL